jgi:outer membrane lipoprotein-sorting protein
MTARARRRQREGRHPLWTIGGAVCALAWLTGNAAAQQLPSLDRVIQHLDELYRSQSSHALSTMTVVRARGTRELTLESWSRGEDDALVVIRAPVREAGTATLRTADGLWSYGARADRLIRIPTGLLSESWMGSHLTNDDLMRETSYDEDYESELAWATRDGTRYLQVTLTPKPEAPVVYTKLVFLLTAGDWVPVLWEFYDRDELVRTISYEHVQQVAGRPLPMRLVIQPADAPNERTVFQYQSLQLDVPVSADLFTRRGLRRVAGQ